ncbi:hypothetical protein [Enterocloster clostridioformis]|nr:hypothetical protein [Enterocloster clostridioformis]
MGLSRVRMICPMDTSSSDPSPYLTFMVPRVVPPAPKLPAGSIITTI